MGQTLTNGIYLPDEGEVRCYAGLASNWTTLDAVVGGYNAHVANENIHITSAERNKWNNGVSQAYVLRYANTSLTALGTVAFSALDNTDNIKIGDKVLDSEGKLFALTAVDTANSTATLSALLIDLSKDSDLSNYYTKPETDTLLNGKADASALTAHTGNTTIHVTAADKEAWNGKADASALTAHTGNTTIHVTAEDKTKWDAVTGKADDTDVVHKSGNETVGGQKTLVNLLPLKGEFLGTEASNNARTLLYFIANRDTQNQSGIYLTKFRQNKAQGSMSGNDVAYLSFDCLENSVRTNNCLRINFLNFVDDIPQRFVLWSGISEKLLGAVGASWSDVFTDQINGLNPSALSMPNLSAGVDISAYITAGNSHNEYTPTVDGWISVALKSTSGACALWIYQNDLFNGYYGGTTRPGETEPFAATCLPVKANTVVNIDTKGSNSYVYAAKFYPCQGNV